MIHDSLVRRASLAVALGLILASSSGAAQQHPPSGKEKQAAEIVAKLVEQTRSQNKLPRLRHINDHYLQGDICSRAAKGDGSNKGQSTGIGPPEKVGMLSVLWYSTSDPNRLTPELEELAKGPAHQYEQPRRFAVAVCLSTTSNHEERYWIEVGTYMSAVKSLLNAATWE